MGLTSELLKQRRAASKVSNEYKDRMVVTSLTVSLRDILAEYLLSHDRVMIEVDPSVLGQFASVLAQPEFQTYRCSQVADNKFVFSANEYLFV